MQGCASEAANGRFATKPAMSAKAVQFIIEPPGSRANAES
jgi:hypothetical protein